MKTIEARCLSAKQELARFANKQPPFDFWVLITVDSGTLAGTVVWHYEDHPIDMPQEAIRQACIAAMRHMAEELESGRAPVSSRIINGVETVQ